MPYKDKYIEYLRGAKRRQNHAEELKTYQIKWRALNPEKLKVSWIKARHKWDAKHPNFRKKQHQAQVIAYKISTGKECEICPDDDKRITKLIRHHPDYDFPTIFITMCTECHKELHLNPNNDKPKPY